jgi:catechol 2,3-dioxygenase-like lactoylglutathione lyase family enzyme
MRLHHAAICATDFDASLRFWRDGLGLEVLMDHSFEGDWPTLFGSSSSKLRSVFLGEAGADDAGVVELVDFGDPISVPSVPGAPEGGFFLLSFNVDLTATLTRLTELGLGGHPREITVHGVRMAVVDSPDGVRVELLDLAAVDLTGL